jgi:hypothetical protein
MDRQIKIAREIAETMLRLHASIAEQMVRAIADEIPEYASSDDAATVLADVTAHCDAQAQAFFSSFLSGAPPEALDIGFAEDAVTRRVRQGVPLEAILHSFRIGHQVAWSAILEHADRVRGGRTAAVLLVDPSIRFIDAMSTLVADVYVREQQRAIAVADRERRDVLELLLTDPSRALPAARSAGIPSIPKPRTAS